MSMPLSPSNRKIAAGYLVLAVFVVLVYSNHFGNGFHFDDAHSVVNNPYIRNLRNIPRFFTDGDTSSVLPANRAWRPLVTTSLAFDYWLGRGLHPFYFHLSTMIWFLVQLGLMLALFRGIFDRCFPAPLDHRDRNIWAALFSTALYAVHPAMAETVNYVIQRADLYSTLGVVAGLVTYVYWPASRRTGLYLIPVAAAVVSKAPAMVFPAILFVYLWLIDDEKPRAALRRCVPSIVAVVALAWLTAAMTPKSLNPGAASAYGYRITQPFVLFRYFRTFFIPAGLTADTDRVPFTSIFQDEALLGFVFLAGLIAAIVWAARRRETRPIAFGLCWFLLAAFPTSIFPLAEVDNDHRMFFPFVGLAMSACWAAALMLYRRPMPRAVLAPACVLILAGCAWGARQRNEVWHTDESLWRDVTLKSPHNGRGLMNYGLALMARGDYAGALDYFHRAEALTPNYSNLEINLGIVNGAIHNNAEAERHFLRAIQLAPAEAEPRYYFARWLRDNGRLPEAAANLRTAVAQNPSHIESQYMLMQTDADLLDSDDLRATAQRVLGLFPGDGVAAAWLARAANLRPTPEAYLNRSLLEYQAGRYAECIAAAQKALELRPNYSEAWNNIAAAWNAQGKWDEGIRAGEIAVKLSPNNQLAKNNLAWARTNKAKAGQ
jgi:tetratricopeptide (TPR) repeat protein